MGELATRIDALDEDRHRIGTAMERDPRFNQRLMLDEAPLLCHTGRAEEPGGLPMPDRLPGEGFGHRLRMVPPDRSVCAAPRGRRRPGGAQGMSPNMVSPATGISARSTLSERELVMKIDRLPGPP